MCMCSKSYLTSNMVSNNHSTLFRSYRSVPTIDLKCSLLNNSLETMFLRREDPTELKLRAATCSSPGILGEIQWRAERENDCGFGFGPAQKNRRAWSLKRFGAIPLTCVTALECPRWVGIHKDRIQCKSGNTTYDVMLWLHSCPNPRKLLGDFSACFHVYLTCLSYNSDIL